MVSGGDGDENMQWGGGRVLVHCAILCSTDWGSFHCGTGIKSGERKHMFARTTVSREIKGKDMRDLHASFLVAHPVRGMVRRMICRDDEISYHTS